MAIDLKAYLLQLPRKVKDPATGQWTTKHEVYLPVRARVMAFREQYPQGIIETEPLTIDVEHGFACFEAVAITGDGGRAIAHGSETRAGFEDFIERGETRAVGRCLGLLGFGTEYAMEMDELPHVADAPVATSPEPTPVDASEPSPPPLTDAQVDGLFALAESCQEPKEVLSTRLKRIMGLPPEAKLTKKLLKATMTPTQFVIAFAYYERLLRQQVEADVPTHDPPPSATASQDAQEPAQAVPGSTIVPAPDPEASGDPDAEAKAALKREALGWSLSVPEIEIDYILSHYPLEKARGLLWGARGKHLRPADAQPTLTGSAA